MAQLDLHVTSETGQLRACALWGPGSEFDAMAPDHIAPLRLGRHGWEPNPDYLLFDDLVLLDHLRQEHAILRAVVAAATGERNCLDLRDMLTSVLAERVARGEIVEQVLDMEAQLGTPAPQLRHARQRLDDLTPVELSAALVTGLDPDDERALLAAPSPNLLFARDLAAVVGNSLVLSYPRARARKRDGIIARGIARHHPRLAGAQVIDIRLGDDSPSEAVDDRTVEGGDVLVVAKDLVLVGLGERTSERGALLLAAALHARGIANVWGVRLPHQRATMHLDTVMTWIEPGRALAWLPGLGGDQAQVVDLVAGGQPIGRDVRALLEARGRALDLVPCGGADPRAGAREQWSDGANAVCLGPGRIVLYGRNRATLRELNRRDYQVLSPDEFIANADLLMLGDRRWVVALPGSELSRGRGGPRCLTLPLQRA